MKEKIVFKLLELLSRLPLPVLYLGADIITLLLYHVINYRRKVVRDNLTSSFPDKSLGEIIKIEKAFYRYLGDQIVETLKLLHISDMQLRQRVKIINFNAVNETLSEGRNAVLLMGHYCNWEWVQEITRTFISDAFMISIYHPLSNKMWDNFFLRLRSRWHAHIVPMKQAPRELLNKANTPWVCGFIADAWTWNKKDDNWVEFLHHKTWFITGPEEIGRKTGADFFYLEMNRTGRGHYVIEFHPLDPDMSTGSYPFTRLFWHELEKTIEKNPPYWLWSHKRWK